MLVSRRPLAVIITLQAALLFGTATSRVSAQLPDIRKMRDDARSATNDFVERKMIRRGACEGKYPRIPEGYLLVPEQALSALDLGGFEAEAKRLDEKITSLRTQQREGEEALAKSQQTFKENEQKQNDALAALEKKQDAVVSDWLRQKYGSKVGEAQKYVIESRVTVVTPWLFGTFVASYPKEIRVGQVGNIEVTFTPAIFSSEVFIPKLQLRPARFARAQIPPNLKVAPTTVSGGPTVVNFQMGEWERVDASKPLRWVFEVGPQNGFTNADFDIVMEASQEDGSTARTAAEIPIKISVAPGKTFWEKYDNLISAIAGGIACAVATAVVARRRTRTPSRIESRDLGKSIQGGETDRRKD